MQGIPKITLIENYFLKSQMKQFLFLKDQYIEFKIQIKNVKIMEVQLGKILKETDIVRYPRYLR